MAASHNQTKSASKRAPEDAPTAPGDVADEPCSKKAKPSEEKGGQIAEQKKVDPKIIGNYRYHT